MPNDNSLTLRIEQNGETTVYEITNGATLTIQAAPEMDANGLKFSGAADLRIDGVAPWSGVEMVVAIAELNVRHKPNTEQDKFTSIPQGTVLTVSSETTENIGFVWRQILAPEKLNGKWIAEQRVNGAQRYIVTPEEAAELRQAAGAGGGVTDGDDELEEAADPNRFTAQGVTETADHEPAPLTGRFQLVEKQGGVNGKYTALSIDCDSRPKLGVNVREFPHFGIPQWKWTDVNLRGDYCRVASEIGMKWVRFFTPHITYSSLQENLDRIGDTLDAIRDNGMVAVVCLTDSLADVGMFPKEDAEWHEKSTPMGHYHKDYFNTNSFRHHYHDHVKAVVSTFKDHKGVGMWQLMNEPAIYNPPASDTDVEGFARWVDETSEMIYSMDTVHPIGIGMINVSHIKPPHHNQQQFAIDFYSKRKYIHVVTCHSYQSIHNGNAHDSWDLEDDCQADIVAAAKTGRAMIWTEFGASQAGNRRMSTERFLNRQLIQNRASAALQWGFMITSNDTGVGDRHFGWSPANINKEYSELLQLFASIPAKVNNL